MTEEEKDDKHPMSGIVSAVLTCTGLIMLAISKPLGFVLTEEYDLSAIAYLFFSMVLATIGIFSGVAGVQHQKKIFPVIGLTLGGIFIICIIYIIFSAVGGGGNLPVNP